MAVADQIVSLSAPESIEADQYRTLRHVIERTRRDTGAQVFAVTSPGAGEGKSVTTLNLAGSLAQSPANRVLVIDADLHRPSMTSYLGLHESRLPGLVDAILDEDHAGFQRSIRRLDTLNLSVIPAGICRAPAYELLNSSRLKRLLDDARREFDYVLIDTPPLVPLPDCRLISQWVDKVIVLVAAHRTPRRALREALGLLEPTRLLGLVFNGDDQPLSPYSPYSYYGYYGGRSDPRATRNAPWWRRRPNTPLRIDSRDSAR